MNTSDKAGKLGTIEDERTGKRHHVRRIYRWANDVADGRLYVCHSRMVWMEPTDGGFVSCGTLPPETKITSANVRSFANC